MGLEEPVTRPQSPGCSEVSVFGITRGPVLGPLGSQNLARPLTASNHIFITRSSLLLILGIKNSRNVAFFFFFKVCKCSDLPHYFVVLSERRLIAYLESKRAMLPWPALLSG